MLKSTSPSFPEPLVGQAAATPTEGNDIEKLVSEVKDYQITHGSLLKLVKFETASTVHARPVGVSLRPTPLRKADFEEATTLQVIFNELYMRAAADFAWLSDVLFPLIKNDRLCHALWDILLQARKVSSVQDIVCGVFRSDYMSEISGIKQVEMNTFSVAGACHAQRIADMHHHLNRIQPLDVPGATGYNSRLPKSGNTASIVGQLSEAHRLYKASTSNPACVLMVVQPFNFNIADERPIEYGLWDHDIPCYRCEWSAVTDSCILAPDRTMLFRNGSRLHEVSVVYFRAGYDAAEYSPGGKQIRLKLELSRAIQCPNIATHLTTLKAV